MSDEGECDSRHGRAMHAVQVVSVPMLARTMRGDEADISVLCGSRQCRMMVPGCKCVRDVRGAGSPCAIVRWYGEGC